MLLPYGELLERVLTGQRHLELLNRSFVGPLLQAQGPEHAVQTEAGNGKRAHLGTSNFQRSARTRRAAASQPRDARVSPAAGGIEGPPLLGETWRGIVVVHLERDPSGRAEEFPNCP